MSEFIKSFIDNDCVVDIIECTNSADITKVAKKKYDCIFGFGEPWVVAVKNNPKALAVMYLTENSPRFSEKHERERLDYFAGRHKKRLPLRRSNLFF